MTIEFIETDKVAFDHGIKVLVYGRSGAGKTRLMTTLPIAEVFVISAEAGLLSVRQWNIKGAKVKTVDDLSELYEWFLHNPIARQFKTIYIDSLTEIGEVILNNAKALAKDPRQAYGELIEKVTMVIKLFRDLPGYNVVMTAKQESHKDEVTQMTSYGPTMPGNKMGQALPYLFDEVLRLGVAKTTEGKEYRFLQCAPDLQYEAKDRSGALDSLEPPDLGLLFSKILARTATP